METIGDIGRSLFEAAHAEAGSQRSAEAFDSAWLALGEVEDEAWLEEDVQYEVGNEAETGWTKVDSTSEAEYSDQTGWRKVEAPVVEPVDLTAGQRADQSTPAVSVESQQPAASTSAQAGTASSSEGAGSSSNTTTTERGRSSSASSGSGLGSLFGTRQRSFTHTDEDAGGSAAAKAAVDAADAADAATTTRAVS